MQVEDMTKIGDSINDVSKPIVKKLDVTNLMQSDYGDVNDCTLTSATSILMYLSGITDTLKEDKIYSIVECKFKRYLAYWKFGTIPFLIDIAMNRLLETFKNGYVSKTKYFNKYTRMDEIIESIDDGRPVMLSMYKGGSIYKNHTVLIKGYYENTTRLIIANNWATSDKSLDLDSVSYVSSFTFIEKK